MRWIKSQKPFLREVLLILTANITQTFGLLIPMFIWANHALVAKKIAKVTIRYYICCSLYFIIDRIIYGITHF